MRKLPYLPLLMIMSWIIVPAQSFAQTDCYELIWSDEFNGNSLDQSKWNYDIGDGCPNLCGWGNGELEYYTDRTENVRVQNGMLTIEARPENFGGRAITSGKIQTRDKFEQTYGRFEARIRMPLGAGHWPAFWMLRHDNNWPMTGEIDIMEYRGDEPQQTTGALHYGSAWPNNQFDAGYHPTGQNLSENFNIYAVEWSDNHIAWYFNDVEFKRVTRDPYTVNPPSSNDPWPWEDDFYIILNNAVGGWFTGITDPNNVQWFKSTLEVDYVRVYDLNSTNTSLTPYLDQPVNLPGVIQAENYDKGCAGIAYSESDAINEGQQYRNEGVDIEVCEDIDGGYNIGFLEPGEWLAYSVNVQQEGVYSFTFRTAGQGQTGELFIELNGQNISGNVSIPPSGGWQTWQNVEVNNVSLPAGEHTLYLKFNQGEFNVNYIETELNVITSVENIAENQFKVYPNPARNGFFVENDYNSDIDQVSIYSITGKLINQITQLNGNQLIGNNLKNGIYILEINHKGKVHYQKVIIE